MFRACRVRAAVALALLVAACGEPVRVDGRTVGEHLARIDEIAAPLRGPLVRELGAFGDAGDAAVPRLAEWLEGDPKLRADAAAALGGIGTADAQRAVLDALGDPGVSPDVVAPAAAAASRCVPADALAAALRSLAQEAPARAARLVMDDGAFETALADPDLRRDVVVALAGQLDRLDRRAQDATLRRVPELSGGAAGHEPLLAKAIDAGVATAAAVDALAAIDTAAAFEVLVERVRAPWKRDAGALLAAVGRLGRFDPERALGAIDRAADAVDPQLRVARLAALAELARAAPAAKEKIAAALTGALEDPHPSVEDAARDTSATLVTEGVLDAESTANAWAGVAGSTENADRARRIASALGSGALPATAAIPALRTLGESGPVEVARAAGRALAAFDDPAARAARIAILGHADGREAVRRATLWAREPTTTFGELAQAIASTARIRPAPSFLTALLEELDRRAEPDHTEARLELLAAVLDDADADRAARVAAARRLLAAAPERAVVTATIGGAKVRLRLLVDQSARATRPADLDPDEGALYALPRGGRLVLDTDGLIAARRLLVLDGSLTPTTRLELTPDGPRIDVEEVWAAAVLPAGVAPDVADTLDLDPDLVRALAR